MAVEVMAEEASGQCARACGARTRVRRVVRTAGVRYASSSGRGQSREQRAWTA